MIFRIQYRSRLVLGILSILGSATSLNAHASAVREIADRNPPGEVLRTSELRSAYLVRCGAVRYDVGDAECVRRQLQRHFDVVLALLIAATPNSVETAVQRLEGSSGQRWSKAERHGIARQLLIYRYLQLARLKAYRDRGLFPLHDGQARGPTPIFVDDHDTACAVGHLMRISGWHRDVAAIERSNNLVYVSNETNGPAQWILTSGLTIEEAALIQPAYPNIPSELPPLPAHAISPMEAGWSGAFDDLRFSNFRFYPSGSAAPSVNAAVTHSFCNSYACSILPRIEDYTGVVEHIGWFELLPNGFDDFERVVVQFDVETILPSHRIVSNPQGATAYTRRDQPVFGQRNDILLFAGDTEVEVFIDAVEHFELLHLEKMTPIFLPGKGIIVNPVSIEYRQPPVVFDQSSFQPTRRMNVVTELLLRDGQAYQAQKLHFDVVEVPEPGTGAILLIALAAIGAQSRGRNYACGRLCGG